MVQRGFADLPFREQEHLLSMPVFSQSAHFKALVYMMAGYQRSNDEWLFTTLTRRGLQQLGYRVIFEV